MTVPDWLTTGLLKDLATIVAASVASYVGIFGLKAWQKQLKGRNDYELARRLLKNTYRIRDGIESIRSPFGSPSEIERALTELEVKDNLSGKNNHERHLMEQQALYAARWNRFLSEPLADLGVDRIEAEVLWGQESERDLVALRSCVTDLSINIKLYLRQLETGRKREDWEKIDSIVYLPSDIPDEDAFGLTVQKAVKQVERLATPYLKL